MCSSGPAEDLSRRIPSTASPLTRCVLAQSNLSRLFVTTYVVALVKAFATGWSPA